jgi:tetratricopeptide (TPR) repeat protein
LYRIGNVGEALRLLLSIQDSSLADRQRYLLILGACFARLKRREEASLAFSDLLSLNPDCHEALTWMAVLKKNPREIGEALKYALRAIQLKPDDAVGFGSLGGCYLYLREPAKAIEALRQAVELSPDAPEHRHSLATALLMEHRHGEAVQHLRKAIELAPEDPQSYLSLAATYSLYGMAGEALNCLEQGLSHLPNNAALHSSTARAFSMIKNDSAAERHYQRAVQLSASARGDFAMWLQNQGRFAEADEIFANLVSERTDPALGYYGLSQTRKITTADSNFIEEMNSLLATEKLRPASKMRMHYALGRAEEQLHNFGSAMDHFDAANDFAYAIHYAGHPIDPSGYSQERAQVRKLYENLLDRPKGSDPKESPIFIVGMIRSGTTLLDQIVSSHSAVESGGELRFWIEETLRLAKTNGAASSKELRDLAEAYLRYVRVLLDSEGRFTDKMPLNFAYCGIIHAALPNAKFLHIRRNPVDTCLSIYTTYFGSGALFAYKKSNIVAYYRDYLQAMESWRRVLPSENLFELDYEDLVSDPQSLIPQVIEFCGLPWDEGCLHHDRNNRAINTPSRWQARQPFYKTSVGKWKHYEPWLGEFGELLQMRA